MVPEIYLAERFARQVRNRVTTSAVREVLEAGVSQHQDIALDGRILRFSLYEIGPGAPTPVTTLPTSAVSAQPVAQATNSTSRKLGLLPLFLLAAIALLLFGGIASCITAPRGGGSTAKATPSTTVTPTSSKPLSLCDMTDGQLTRAFQAPAKRMVVTNVYWIGQCMLAVQGDFVVPQAAKHDRLLGFIQRGNGLKDDKYQEYIEVAPLTNGKYFDISSFPGKTFNGTRWTLILVNPPTNDTGIQDFCNTMLGLYDSFLQPGDKRPSACYTFKVAH